jgi:phage terminase large subunit-like protein
VKEYRPKGDKAERLKMAGAPLQAKLVFFAKNGCDELKAQLTGYGYERFDDLVDAFSQGINEIMVDSFLPNLDTIVLG